MIREIIHPDSEDLKIKLPENYVGKDLELLIFPVSEAPIFSPTDYGKLKKAAETAKSLGIFKDVDSLDWQKKIRDEWR